MTYPRKTMADFLGDRVAWRSLNPTDPDLPQLADIRQEVGLESLRIPRKTEPIYAAVAMKYLAAAQKKRGLPPLERLLFIGDTPMNDGTVARNMGALPAGTRLHRRGSPERRTRPKN